MEIHYSILAISNIEYNKINLEMGFVAYMFKLT